MAKQQPKATPAHAAAANPKEEEGIIIKKGVKHGVFYNEVGKVIHAAWTLDKKKKILSIFPYGYRRINHTINFPKSVKQVQIKGWDAYGNLPLTLRRKDKSPGLTPQLKDIVKFFYKQNPKFNKLIIDNGVTVSRFTPNTVSLVFADFKDMMVGLKKLKDQSSQQRKNYIFSQCSAIFSNFPSRKRKLAPGALADFLSVYDQYDDLSTADVDAVTQLINDSSTTTILHSSFTLQTKDKLNIVFLEDVIKKFEKLIKKTSIKEAEWDRFFTEYSWVLTYIFPYQAVLFQSQAYVGGKSYKDEGGRIVDYLFANKLTDNMALIEIKMHTTELFNQTLYRKPATYSVTAEISGAVNQLLDQKDQLIKHLHKDLRVFNPRALLIAGSLKDLDDNQRNCFELYRFNLNSLSIVTFDEVLEKLKGLHTVLTDKKQ